MLTRQELPSAAFGVENWECTSLPPARGWGPGLAERQNCHVRLRGSGLTGCYTPRSTAPARLSRNTFNQHKTGNKEINGNQRKEYGNEYNRLAIRRRSLPRGTTRCASYLLVSQPDYLHTQSPKSKSSIPVPRNMVLQRPLIHTPNPTGFASDEV